MDAFYIGIGMMILSGIGLLLLHRPYRTRDTGQGIQLLDPPPTHPAEVRRRFGISETDLPDRAYGIEVHLLGYEPAGKPYRQLLPSGRKGDWPTYTEVERQNYNRVVAITWYVNGRLFGYKTLDPRL